MTFMPALLQNQAAAFQMSHPWTNSGCPIYRTSLDLLSIRACVRVGRSFESSHNPPVVLSGACRACELKIACNRSAGCRPRYEVFKACIPSAMEKYKVSQGPT